MARCRFFSTHVIIPAKILLLQLSGLVGSGLHGIYGCGAEAHFFQYLAAGDGGAAGGGYHVFKLCGVHAGFKYHLGGAHYGLGSKAVSGCAGKTFQDAAVPQRLYEFRNEGWTGAGEAACRVDEVLVHPLDDAYGAEEFLCKSLLIGGEVGLAA